LDNILIKSSAASGIPWVKIADFGLARAVGDGELMRTICGTPSYLAPEIICRSSSSTPYSKSVDIWALGVMLYALHIKSFPFDTQLQGGNVASVTLESYVQASRLTEDCREFARLSVPLRSLLTDMLQINPEKRITIDAAILHPWTQADDSGNPGPLYAPFDVWGSLHYAFRQNHASDQDPTIITSNMPIDLFRSCTTIGRSRSCHIQIPDPRVSSAHCEIFLTDTSVHIRSLSRNPCWVNGKSLRANQTSVLESPYEFALCSPSPDENSKSRDADAVKPALDGQYQRIQYCFRLELCKKPWKQVWATSERPGAAEGIVKLCEQFYSRTQGAMDYCSIVFNDAHISQLHCILEFVNGQAQLANKSTLRRYALSNRAVMAGRLVAGSTVLGPLLVQTMTLAQTAGLKTSTKSGEQTHSAQEAAKAHSEHLKKVEEEHKRMLERYAESNTILDRYSVMPGKSSDYMSILQRITSENASEVRREKQPLVLKRIRDSYVETYLPFKDNLTLREDYVNYYGDIRLGKVLEDLDRLAGAVAYKHASDANGDLAPIVFVTASVDRIDLKTTLSPNRNYRLAGTVTYVGFSSMEIHIQAQAVPEPDEPSDPEPNLVARFTMVGRDKYTGKASQVNPLLLEDESQRRLVKVSEQIKEHKKSVAQANLTKRPPSAEERLVIHQLWLETSKYQNSMYGSRVHLPEDMVWLDQTIMESVTVCFPSERNVHNKIFGGYLMRLAHELSFANGSVFTQSRPSYVSLDDFSFKKPVNIGSILRLKSQVVYSEPENKTFQVAVSADVIDNMRNTAERTNTFYFNFCCPGGVVRRIVPRSYEDMMKYLEGRRRAQTGKIISKLQSEMQNQ
ncbi:hypothetical protein GGI15_002630, partial [Coemansia interrupta]